MISILPENNRKIAVVIVFENSTFIFLYNVRKTTLNEFPDLSYFNMRNFQPNTTVVIKMQIYLQKFKPKKRDKYS